MPRSFLVKQPKVHDFSSSGYYHQYQQQQWDDPRSVTHAITESATNLAVRLSENGELTSSLNFLTGASLRAFRHRSWFSSFWR